MTNKYNTGTAAGGACRFRCRLRKSRIFRELAGDFPLLLFSLMPFDELVEIMKKLRDPDKGCPWDLEQTRESLKPFLVEETYEVLEAIDKGKPPEIKEELGDLLFQIVFHAQVADDMEEFNIEDVIGHIRDKMIRRHPHVFGDADFSNSEEVLANWEEEKKREGKQRASILEGIPRTLPGLMRAHRLQERAARVGFDWQRRSDAVAHLDDEIAEFKEALSRNDESGMEDEFGDILFMLVNISRFVGVNPEDALRRTISKFIRRFRHIEMAASESGIKLSDMSLEEMDAIWEDSKKRE